MILDFKDLSWFAQSDVENATDEKTNPEPQPESEYADSTNSGSSRKSQYRV